MRERKRRPCNTNSAKTNICMSSPLISKGGRGETPNVLEVYISVDLAMFGWHNTLLSEDCLRMGSTFSPFPPLPLRVFFWENSTLPFTFSRKTCTRLLPGYVARTWSLSHSKFPVLDWKIIFSVPSPSLPSLPLGQAHVFFFCCYEFPLLTLKFSG